MSPVSILSRNTADNPVAVFLPKPHNAGIEACREPGHPFRSFLGIRLVAPRTAGKLPEELKNILEKTGLCTAGSEVNRQPHHFYGVRNCDFPANILVDVFFAGMINVIEQRMAA
jgi:hypothetical protein